MSSQERADALRLARRLGCEGAHEQDGVWMPCASHEELVTMSRAAEPKQKSARRRRRRRLVSRRGWERLRERPVPSIRTTEAGLTSGPPGSEVTDSGPTGSTGTAVAGGVMGGIVDGSLGASYSSGGSFAAVKRLPVDADGDGFINDGTPTERFIGVDAAAQALTQAATAAGRAASGSGSSKRRQRKPGSMVRVADRSIPAADRAAAARGVEERMRRDVDTLTANERVDVAPDVPLRSRHGRKPRKLEQMQTPEGMEARTRNWQGFRRSTKPKGLKPQTTVSEMRQSGIKKTSEFFGIRGRDLHQPGVPAERAAVYDSIARALVYGSADDPIDLPVHEQPTLHLMGGGPASGKTFLREAGFFDIPDRTEAAHIEVDEGRKMLPEYDDMLRDMGGDVKASQALCSGVNHEEATHVGRLAADLAMRNRHDVVLDSTGDGGPVAFSQRIRMAREAGYRVKAHFATVSITKALADSEERARKEQRGVDPKELIETHVDVARAVLYGLQNGMFDELTLVDNEDHNAPTVFAEFKAGRLTVYNLEMWDAFIKKAVMTSDDYEHDYFVRNPLTPDDLAELKAKAAKLPKIKGKKSERLKEQGDGVIVVLAPDGKTVWYEVSSPKATTADFRKLLDKEPPAGMVPMKVTDDSLYRVRSGRLEPHIPELPPEPFLPAMTRRAIRIAAMSDQTLEEAGIADTKRHRDEYKTIRKHVVEMLGRGVLPQIQPHLVEAMPDALKPAEDK